MRPQSLSPPFSRSKVMAWTAMGTLSAHGRKPRPCSRKTRNAPPAASRPNSRAARQHDGVDAGHRHLRLEQGGLARAGSAAPVTPEATLAVSNTITVTPVAMPRVVRVADAEPGQVGDEAVGGGTRISTAEAAPFRCGKAALHPLQRQSAGLAAQPTRSERHGAVAQAAVEDGLVRNQLRRESCARADLVAVSIRAVPPCRRGWVGNRTARAARLGAAPSDRSCRPA